MNSRRALRQRDSNEPIFIVYWIFKLCGARYNEGGIEILRLDYTMARITVSSNG